MTNANFPLTPRLRQRSVGPTPLTTEKPPRPIDFAKASDASMPSEQNAEPIFESGSAPMSAGKSSHRLVVVALLATTSSFGALIGNINKNRGCRGLVPIPAAANKKGRDSRDILLGLAKTCRKLKISFYEFIGDRLSIPGPKIPPLATLVTAPAD
jgi:hypothetical protein